MAKIDITRPHSFPAAEIRKKVEGIAERVAGRYGLSHEWQGDRVLFHGKGVKGHIAVGERDVRILVEMGLFASMLKTKIEDAIGRELDQLGAA